MQPRQKTFSALRRLVLQDFRARPQRLQLSIAQNARLHYRPTPPLLSPEPEKSRPKVGQKFGPMLPGDYYILTFTCKPCSTRSTHKITKHGYYHGSVLITCPECKNRHIISDHLKIFQDRDITIEDLMREKGQLVKKGSLSEDLELEFWKDTERARLESGDKKAAP